MKKSISLLSLAAASVLSVAFAFIIVTTTHAQTVLARGTTPAISLVCPAGYICTSTNAPSSPVGDGGGSNVIAATISLDPSSPLSATIPVTNPTIGNYLGLPVLVFDVKAQGSNAYLQDVYVNISSPTGGSGGTLAAAYLYQGSTPIQSAAIVNGVANFAKIPVGTPGAMIPAGTTLPYTVKADVVNVSGGPGFIVQSKVQAPHGIQLTTPSGAMVSATGSAIGNTITVISTTTSPIFSLSGAPTLIKQVSSVDQWGNATDTYTATFNVQVNVGLRPIVFGLPSNAGWSSFPTAAKGSSVWTVYQNGVASSNGYNQAVSYSAPAGAIATSTYFIVAPNQTVTIPVTFVFQVRNPGSNVFGVGLKGIEWMYSSGTTTQVTPELGWATTGELVTPVTPVTPVSPVNNTLAPVQSPRVTSISASAATIGAVVVIKGSGLNSTVSNPVVICGPGMSTNCGDYPGTPTANGTMVTFTVPSLSQGGYTIAIQNGHGTSNTVPFSITTPTIKSVGAPTSSYPSTQAPSAPAQSGADSASMNYNSNAQPAASAQSGWQAFLHLFGF